MKRILKGVFSHVHLQWFAAVSTTTLTGLVKTAYSKAVEFSFQPQLFFAQFAQTKRWSIADRDPMPGDTVVFTIFGNLAAATGALSETGDPASVGLTKTQKPVAMAEYGRLVTTTQKIRTLSFANIDLTAATVVGFNMGQSVDYIARAAFDAVATAAGYYKYASGAINRTGVLAGMTMKAKEVRYAYNRLLRQNVLKPDGMYYIAVVHPDVLYDLRAETGAGSWRSPKEYTDPAQIYNGEIGEFEGFRFVVTSQARERDDYGSSKVDLYTSYFFGYQAVGYAEGIPPAMGLSGPFDALQRLFNVYWYGLFGFAELRREALFKVYSSSSVGVNV
jgi:N4-gp56 family major capsid protein